MNCATGANEKVQKTMKTVRTDLETTPRALWEEEPTHEKKHKKRKQERYRTGTGRVRDCMNRAGETTVDVMTTVKRLLRRRDCQTVRTRATSLQELSDCQTSLTAEQ